MRILYLPGGGEDEPATRYRVHAHVPALRGRGHEVVVRPALAHRSPSRRLRRLARPLDLVRDGWLAEGFDVVVAFRKTYPHGTWRWLRRRARRLVFEFDDAIWLPSPSEPQDEATRRRHARNFAVTAAAADLVIAGNRTLAAAVADRPAVVIPTGVDTGTFRPDRLRPQAGRFVVGWLGTADNLPQWQRLRPVFERLIAAVPHARFKVISNHEPEARGLPVDYERFTLAREATCLADVDVAIMPLEDTPWNRGKCAAKALHGMAMGLPVVLSPVGMNEEVVRHGVSGFLAGGDDEWLAALTALAGDPELRRRMGEAGRRTVEERYAAGVVSKSVVAALERLGQG